MGVAMRALKVQHGSISGRRWHLPPQSLLIVVLSAGSLFAGLLNGQTSAPGREDFPGIDQGLEYFAKLDEFGEGPHGTVAKRLSKGAAIEQDLRGGEVVDFAVALSAGQFMELVVEQRGIHVSVSLFGSEKRKLVEMDSANGISGIEPLRWVAPRAAVFTVEVNSIDRNALPGRFVISLKELRDNEPADRKLLYAQQVYSYNFDVSKRVGQEAQLNAIAGLEQAMKLWKEAGDDEREEQTRHALARSHYTLGVIYEGGHGVPRDEQRMHEAFSAALEGWYRAAAERGEAEAQTVMGDVHLFGRGAPQDMARAFTWYRRAAEQGYARAGNNLGYLYLRGVGTDRDLAEAIRWFRKSAEGGNAVAARNIGMLYRDGVGVAQNGETATGWFKKAAERGDRTASRLLNTP